MEIHGKHNERQVRGPRARAPRPAGGALVPDPGASRGRGRRRPGRGCPGSPHLPGGGSRSSPGNARSREPSLGGGAVATARAALTDAPSASPVLAVTSQRPSAPGAPVFASRQVAQPSAGPWPAGPAVGTRGAGACGSRGAAPGGGGVSGRAGTGARGSRVRDVPARRGAEGPGGARPAASQLPGAGSGPRALLGVWRGGWRPCPRRARPFPAGAGDRGCAGPSAVQGERASCARWLSTPRGTAGTLDRARGPWGRRYKGSRGHEVSERPGSGEQTQGSEWSGRDSGAGSSARGAGAGLSPRRSRAPGLPQPRPPWESVGLPPTRL